MSGLPVLVMQGGCCSTKHHILTGGTQPGAGVGEMCTDTGPSPRTMRPMFREENPVPEVPHGLPVTHCPELGHTSPPLAEQTGRRRLTAISSVPAWCVCLQWNQSRVRRQLCHRQILIREVPVYWVPATSALVRCASVYLGMP